MKMPHFKTLALAIGVLALPLSACGGSGTAEEQALSRVGVNATFLGFGDDVSFEVTANRTDATGTYESGLVTVATSGSTSVPATGSATLEDVPFGTYTFTVDIYESGTLSFSKSYDNSGAGYEVDSDEESFEFNVALGDGDSLTGTVSEFYSTVSVTLNFDFPPEVTLTTDDVETPLDYDGTSDDFVTAKLANNTISFIDYEEAGSTTGVDLCSIGASSYITTTFAVRKSDGTTCDVTDATTVLYYKTGDYTASTCGSDTDSGSDCCRFEATLESADLGDCASGGETLTSYQSFLVTVTGTDSSGNSSSATINVQMAE